MFCSTLLLHLPLRYNRDAKDIPKCCLIFHINSIDLFFKKYRICDQVLSILEDIKVRKRDSVKFLTLFLLRQNNAVTMATK